MIMLLVICILKTVGFSSIFGWRFRLCSNLNNSPICSSGGIKQTTYSESASKIEVNSKFSLWTSIREILKKKCIWWWSQHFVNFVLNVCLAVGHLSMSGIKDKRFKTPVLHSIRGSNAQISRRKLLAEVFFFYFALAYL